MSTVLQAASELLERLAQAGYKGFIVGGFVRDRLMKRPTGDLDIASSATPQEILELFDRVHPTGLGHGTVTVMVGDLPIEHTTFRTEGTYSDHRRPDSVQFVTEIEDDLARRDFTVNAIAWNPLADSYIDPFGGRQDVHQGRLRAVGAPRDRLQEDALRILRAVRFATTHDFELDMELRHALAATAHKLKEIAVERIEDELDKILSRSSHPSRGFRLMHELNLLEVILPEFIPMIGQRQNRHHAHDVWDHTLQVLDACPAEPTDFRWAALFHDLGKPLTAEPHSNQQGDFRFFGHEKVSLQISGDIGKRLKFSKARQRRVDQMIAHHMVHPTDDWGDSAIRRLLRKLPGEDLDDYLTFKRADVTGKGTDDVNTLLEQVNRIEERLRREQALGHALQRRDLAIDSHDLMTLASRPGGPWLGALQDALLEAVVEDPSFNQRERLESMARTWLANHFTS